ncbi:MAG TPA: hypothetical protein DCE78_03115 [Bacteroidetes bacterium]|nr:hypothetical protein [Bacteroidota bacterium]
MDHKRSIKLPKRLSSVLSLLPEQGMGYQIVDIRLKSGKWITQIPVYNSELLVIDDIENILSKEITAVRVHEDSIT